VREAFRGVKRVARLLKDTEKLSATDLRRCLVPWLGSSVLKCEAVGFLGIGLCCLPGFSSRSGPRRSLGRPPDQPLGPDTTDTVARVTIEVDLPPDVEITGDERHHDGHGFGVRWPLPERRRGERCGQEDRAHIEFKTSPQAIRDLDVWGQPGFGISQAPVHRWARGDPRQHIRPPSQRKDTASTSRCEQVVLRSLIGSTAEDVARRLGISAETVERLVEDQ
jgi:hypothetical protein